VKQVSRNFRDHTFDINFYFNISYYLYSYNYTNIQKSQLNNYTNHFSFPFFYFPSSFSNRWLENEEALENKQSLDNREEFNNKSDPFFE
jgi:hypothetical protein